MAVALLEDWCKGMDMDPRRAVLIVGIPIQCGEEEINEAIRATLEPHLPHKVVGCMFRREDNAKAVFLELLAPMNYALMPTHILGRGGAWEVVVKPRNTDDEFMDHFNFFLKDEGRRLVDVITSMGYKAAATSEEPKEVYSLQSPNDSMWYRKLKVFSGGQVPLPGEEPFEIWLEQAQEMLLMWQVTEFEKRRRLLESLRGPAQAIMRVLRANNEAISVQECLDALTQIFGSKEDGRSSQYHFLQATQKIGEKTSVYLLHLEPLLHKAVQHSPISIRSMDTIRLKHILSRASLTPPLRGKLEVLDQRCCPPTFLEMMKLVRDEEAWEMSQALGKEKSKAGSRARRPSNRQVAVEVHGPAVQTPASAAPLVESGNQTGKEGASPIIKRRHLPYNYSSVQANPALFVKMETELVAMPELPGSFEESGNGVGAGAVSHPRP
ncbi:paraneoplastic antigen-like protein 5 [Echinops telfairi]|uniref:Paraneoplastic antigen-like protein 5 n=4 Tax=Echinops telfairi TaxID=9371 RepID=A0AC55CMR2_ECHTE|nr:paraneoplastic antigen-like protein 5 [Echinops telfairi]XP_045141485.1 paraneoplastic antigen-like protein 5 [Echinops telfairi]XP_045141486.1 paraneoplastic antigen-like protein 5 [Echinops telfairi]XP_045141487.1 paraneoplastic antigen-like protein 5 [Echinops telfairi]